MADQTPLYGTALPDEPDDGKWCGIEKDMCVKILNAIVGFVMVVTGLANLFTLDISVGDMIFIYLAFAVY